MILTYEAIDTAGRRMGDTVEAADAKEAVEQLRHRGLYVTHIAAKSQKVKTSKRQNVKISTFRRFDVLTFRTGLPLKTLVLFTRQIAMMLRAGGGIVPAIMAIKRHMNKPTQAALLGRIIDDLEEGATLTDALRKHPHTFDPVYCAVIAAGEASGKLTEMFERLATIVGKRREMRNKVLGALAYPTLLMFMCFHILLAVLFFVLPRFNEMFTQLSVEAPASTKLLLATGALLAGHWPVVLGITVALGTTVVLMLNSARGRQWMSDVQISIPAVGRLRSHLIQAQVFRTMGMLLESGVGVLDTLDLVRESTRNNRFQKLFGSLETAVTSGGRLSTAFEGSGIVEPYVCQAIHTGEESGNPGGALTYCAEMLDETNAELINVVLKLIEPIILIGMGLVVGGVAISLFLPLFDLTSALQ